MLLDPRKKKIYVSMGTVVPTTSAFFNSILNQFTNGIGIDVQLIISVGPKVNIEEVKSEFHLVSKTLHSFYMYRRNF